MPESKNEIIVYQPDETIRLKVRLENDTVWLNWHQMAQLFGRDIKTIGKHIANALREELSEFSTGQNLRQLKIPCKIQLSHKIATTAADGKTYQIEYYSLDVILSVGYRVKSSQGVVFRPWVERSGTQGSRSTNRNQAARGFKTILLGPDSSANCQ